MAPRAGKKCFLAFCLLLLLSTGATVNAPAQEKILIDQKMISIATITDTSLIKFFLEAFFISETNVTRMEFIDATANGFGEEDLVKVYPSEKIYLTTPSDTAQKVMHSWKFTDNYQTVTQNKPPEVFENLPTNKAENWILAGLLKSLNWQYRDLPMKLRFERDSTTTLFEMWGFNRSALSWRPPPPPPRIPETTYDVIHVLRSDTLFVADTTYYDQFYIYRTIRDTLFISEQDLQKGQGTQPPAFLPGLLPPRRRNTTLKNE